MTIDFDKQDLVGKWCIHRGELAKIAEIKFSGSKYNYTDSWKPSYPIRLMYLALSSKKDPMWVHTPHFIYLHEVELIEPEVADIFMQARGLSIPDKGRKSQTLDVGSFYFK